MKARIVTLAIGALVASRVGGLVGCARPAVMPREASAASPAATAHDDAWASLTWEERHDQMTWLVHPRMARLFQRFEKTPFPELTCRTCHGSDAEKVQYKMPNGLPPLDPTNMPDPKQGPDAEVAKFMYEEVTPTMAELLGVAVSDPRSGHGFSCFSCHPAEP